MTSMSSSGGLTGVVCDDRRAVRRSVSGLLVRCGFDVAGEVASFAELRQLVTQTRPTVAVFTLPLAGMSGLAAVRRLRAEVPTCQVVVLSNFDQLHVAAVEAGAIALLPEESPQALRSVLLSIAAAHAPPDVITLPGARQELPDAGRQAPDAGKVRTKPSS